MGILKLDNYISNNYVDINNNIIKKYEYIFFDIMGFIIDIKITTNKLFEIFIKLCLLTRDNKHKIKENKYICLYIFCYCYFKDLFTNININNIVNNFNNINNNIIEQLNTLKPKKDNNYNNKKYYDLISKKLEKHMKNIITKFNINNKKIIICDEGSEVFYKLRTKVFRDVYNRFTSYDNIYTNFYNKDDKKTDDFYNLYFNFIFIDNNRLKKDLKNKLKNNNNNTFELLSDINIDKTDFYPEISKFSLDNNNFTVEKLYNNNNIEAEAEHLAMYYYDTKIINKKILFFSNDTDIIVLSLFRKCNIDMVKHNNKLIDLLCDYLFNDNYDIQIFLEKYKNENYYEYKYLNVENIKEFKKSNKINLAKILLLFGNDIIPEIPNMSYNHIDKYMDILNKTKNDNLNQNLIKDIYKHNNINNNNNNNSLENKDKIIKIDYETFFDKFMNKIEQNYNILNINELSNNKINIQRNINEFKYRDYLVMYNIAILLYSGKIRKNNLYLMNYTYIYNDFIINNFDDHFNENNIYINKNNINDNNIYIYLFSHLSDMRNRSSNNNNFNNELSLNIYNDDPDKKYDKNKKYYNLYYFNNINELDNINDLDDLNKKSIQEYFTKFKDSEIYKKKLNIKYVKFINKIIINDNLNIINYFTKRNEIINDNDKKKLDNDIQNKILDEQINQKIQFNNHFLFHKYKNKYMNENLNINLSYLLHTE